MSSEPLFKGNLFKGVINCIFHYFIMFPDVHSVTDKLALCRVIIKGGFFDHFLYII